MGIFDYFKKKKSGIKISKDEIKAMDIVLKYTQDDMRKELNKLVECELKIRKNIDSLKVLIDKKEKNPGFDLEKPIYVHAKDLKSIEKKYFHQIEHLIIEKEFILNQNVDNSLHLDPHSPLMTFIAEHDFKKKDLTKEIKSLKERIECVTA